MSWNIRYLDEVDDDFKKLDGSQIIKVRKAIKRTLTNPLPHSEGGYGIALGHKGGINLANCLEIKLRGEGLRVICKLIRTTMTLKQESHSTHSNTTKGALQWTTKN